MINGGTVNGSVINGQIQFDVTDEWKQVKLGPNITGTVVARVNKDSTVSLLGNIHLPEGQPAGTILVYGSQIFEFNLVNDVGLNAHQNTPSGSWQILGVCSSNGNLVTKVNEHEGRSINLFSGDFYNTDMPPVVLPIIRK
ncbi:hypothetical protein RIN67_03160 [Levilactobacillus namurensis]|uniref:hypothetical protein n=1 Tax=Levilactobacillus namurensis TaxID=380393 RepID=UPI0028B27F8D|nr:hypothetical protein [Levilactobacillus namurensis]MDT7019291.1 hypothetical protein [Levilactobacillus namurensis]WNN66108.1 hypothetical protein RIN67_03160 [Levilactobacillus namurensis]